MKYLKLKLEEWYGADVFIVGKAGIDPLAVPDHKIGQCIERSAFFQLRQMECLKVPREAPERRGG